ncbi:MAG TPA: GNAT family N-acetyltransferase [Anaerolineae bacterium]|nr:GNAT family N-acetyltransferase [Anaerolineae bacterium]HQK14179.1 GNAT family N-acetyltransferase [Anaerolineae bacterium]
MRIRAAREEDWKACLELNITYETESAWQMEALRDEGEWGARFREVRLPRRQRITPPISPEARVKGWAHSDAFWVAVEQRAIWGYLALRLAAERSEARITDLAVGEAYRRHGVATALLEQALEWCGRKEVEYLILECPLKAQPAIGFAAKHRFVFCGFQDAYWPGQEVALFFRKRVR